MSKYALVVAGGKGQRFGSNVPKQFLTLNKLPVLMYSINAFYKYDHKCIIIVCLPKEHIELWQILCKKYHFNIPHKIVTGGETRFHSVKNGLHAISENEGFVAIHDGVRPLVSIDLISKLYEEATKYNSAVPCISLVDSIRKIENKKSFAVDRSLFKAIQTPQCFNLSMLKQAYQQKYNHSFTDDAAVFENMGSEIHLVEGETKNIKITTAEDLAIAEVLTGYL